MSQFSPQNQVTTQQNDAPLDSQYSVMEDSPTIGRTTLLYSPGSSSPLSDTGSHRYVEPSLSHYRLSNCYWAILYLFLHLQTGHSARRLQVLYKQAQLLRRLLQHQRLHGQRLRTVSWTVHITHRVRALLDKKCPSLPRNVSTTSLPRRGHSINQKRPLQGL